MNFLYNPTGILYNDLASAYSAKTYRLQIIKEKGIIRQKEIMPLRIFRPESGWLESNEPEDHLDDVALELNKLYETIDNILCFSYKDLSLANRVKNANSNIDILFSNKTGLFSNHFEEMEEEAIFEKIKNLKTKYNLVIIRHYLEHFENIGEIMSVLRSKMSDKSICFLEVPDCNDFIKNKNPIFLWEQHRWYFTYSNILNWLKNFGWEIVKSYSVNYKMEPSLCFFIRSPYSSLIEKINNSILSKDNKNILSFEIFDDYLKGWEKYIKNSSNKFALIGIGHNSDRFLQWTNTKNNINYLIDDAAEKQGKFLAKCKIKINSNKQILNQNTITLLGVHPRNSEKLKVNLQKKFNLKNIFSIFNSAPY